MNQVKIKFKDDGLILVVEINDYTLNEWLNDKKVKRDIGKYFEILEYNKISSS